MSADLTEIQQDTGADLVARLERLQLAQQVHGGRALILFDGWEGSGKTRALRRLAALWDPCQFATYCALRSDDRHWLARYWGTLPTPGRTTLFCGSWYRELVLDRLTGRISDKAWVRRCDEINEFEAQQRDDGTALIKLFFDVAAPVQAERLAARDADPWARFTALSERPRMRDSEQAAWSDLFGRTDTRWAPWLLIDANDLGAAEDKALHAVAEALGKAIPNDPPEEAQRAAG